MMRPTMLTASLLVTLGCAASDSVDAGPNTVAGVWQYQATQRTPSLAAIDGQIELSGASAGAITGAMQGVERDPGGASQTVAALAAGRLVGGTTLDLTLEFASGSRRHVGTLRHDSIVGSWTTSIPPIASGPFTMVRR